MGAIKSTERVWFELLDDKKPLVFRVPSTTLLVLPNFGSIPPHLSHELDPLLHAIRPKAEGGVDLRFYLGHDDRIIIIFAVEFDSISR